MRQCGYERAACRRLFLTVPRRILLEFQSGSPQWERANHDGRRVSLAHRSNSRGHMRRPDMPAARCNLLRIDPNKLELVNKALIGEASSAIVILADLGCGLRR